MTTQLNLFDEFSLSEGVDVEYKTAKGGLPGSVWETYSAFANTEGGTIWLGLAQDGTRLVIHGVPDPDKLIIDFWNTINNRNKVSANLLVESDVAKVEIKGLDKCIIRIRVPRADRGQRPVYVGPDPFKGTYRRNHEGDYRCNEHEVRRMFSDQPSAEPADSRILDGFALDDIHSESLRQYRNRFASLRPGHAWLAEDDRGLLEKLGGWRRDRKGGREGLTVAGLLMFGRDQAIRDPAAVPGYQLDYRERFSEDPAVRWTDRLTLDGTWEGNLFQFYQQTALKLSLGPGIKRPFRKDAEGYRIAGTSIDEALQEALVNALIHADYGGQGGIVIDRYLDRFEFSNPGTLLVSRDQLQRGGISECRNKSLQVMFQMLGVGDKAGSGIDKIRSSWAAEHWQSPILRETLRPDRVVLELPMISTLPEEVLAHLEGAFGESFKELGPDEVQALVTAQVEGGITNQRLQDMLTLHRVDITRMLRALVREGYLLSDGVGRWTRYTIAASPLGSPPKSTAPLLSSPPNAPAPPLGSPPNGESSTLNMLVETNAAPIIETEPRFGAELLDVAKPVREARRAPPEMVRQTILKLCSQQFLTMAQLAALLGRGVKKLRDRHVSVLVAQKLLDLKHPDAPNHPDQAYRSASKDRER